METDLEQVKREVLEWLEDDGINLDDSATRAADARYERSLGDYIRDWANRFPDLDLWCGADHSQIRKYVFYEVLPEFALELRTRVGAAPTVRTRLITAAEFERSAKKVFGSPRTRIRCKQIVDMFKDGLGRDGPVEIRTEICPQYTNTQSASQVAEASA